MKNIFGNKLKNIRKIKGLTLEEVSCNLNRSISKQALSKYERGIMHPSPLVMKALLDFYQIKRESLSGEKAGNISNIYFRSQQIVSSKLKQQFQSDVTLWLEHYLTLEDILSSHIEFNNPFSTSNSITYDFENMELCANKLREEWELGKDSIPSVCRMLELCGIKIIEKEWEEDIDGVCGWGNKKIPFILLKRDVNVERKRFTALHELAHLLFPSINNLTFKTRERLCHRFASALLLPKKTVNTYIGQHRNQLSLQELTSIRTSYGISIAATVHRLKDLNIICDKYYNHIFDNIIKKNIMEEGWGQYPLSDNALRYSHLVQRGIAEGLISYEELTESTKGELKKEIKDICIL